MDIKLKVKLSAYSKLPILDYITDVPKSTDDKIYGRKNGEWVEIDSISGTSIIVDDTSGLSLEDTEDHKQLLKIKQCIGIKPELFEDDFTYYIIDRDASLFINGGTAFSSGYEEFNILNQFKNNINGGKANTINWDSIITPLNAKGVLDE